jgi:hypothetical protein
MSMSVPGVSAHVLVRAHHHVCAHAPVRVVSMRHQEDLYVTAKYWVLHNLGCENYFQDYLKKDIFFESAPFFSKLAFVSF